MKYLSMDIRNTSIKLYDSCELIWSGFIKEYPQSAGTEVVKSYAILKASQHIIFTIENNSLKRLFQLCLLQRYYYFVFVLIAEEHR